jgi:hypothetical protein
VRIRLALALLIAFPAMAFAQTTAPAHMRMPPPKPSAAQPAADASIPAPPAPVAPLAGYATAANDPDQCRMSCAQSAYFCRAGDDASSCDGAWSQCVASCNMPNLAPAYSTAP